MKAKITSEILKEYFDCAYKTYLKFCGECGEKTEFQKLLYEKEKGGKSAVNFCLSL